MWNIAAQGFKQSCLPARTSTSGHSGYNLRIMTFPIYFLSVANLGDSGTSDCAEMKESNWKW